MKNEVLEIARLVILQIDKILAGKEQAVTLAQRFEIINSNIKWIEEIDGCEMHIKIAPLSGKDSVSGSKLQPG